MSVLSRNCNFADTLSKLVYSLTYQYMMKKLFLFAALLFAALAATAAKPSMLKVNLVAGDPVTFLFDTKPEISFLGNQLRVTSLEHLAPVTFDFDNIQFLDFPEYDSVGEIPSSEITVATTPQAIVIGNLPEGSVVDVFSINGTNVFHSEASESCSIDRSRLGKGIFIVKINRTSFKISI